MIHILQVLFVVFVGFSITEPAFAQTVEETAWTRMDGTAVDISINADGQAYVTAPNGTPWRWDKVEQRWRPMSGNFIRISAAEGNRPWAINADRKVYRYNGLWWEEKDTDVVDVAADTNGNVYIAKKDGTLRKWYSLRSEWRAVSGPKGLSISRIALSPSGQLWAVDRNGGIYTFDGKSWSILPSRIRARDLALGSTNVLMVVDVSGNVVRWNGGQRRFVVLPGISHATALGITPNGKAWVVVQGGIILGNGSIALEGAAEDTATTPAAKVPTAPVNKSTVVTAGVPTSPVSIPTVPSAQSMTATGGSVPEVSGSSTTTTDAGDPATITTKAKITFINTLASASTLAIGGDGSVFGLDGGSNVLRWSNKKKAFDGFPGTLVRIAVDNEGGPWGISALGRVFRHNGSQWKQIKNVTAVDISIGYDNTVLIANALGKLLKFNYQQGRFELIKGNGIVVAVGPDGTPWTLRSDKLVQRCDRLPCTVIAQKAISIAVGPDASVWIVSERNKLMRLNKKGSFEAVQTPGHTPLKVAVGPSGYPWVVSTNNIALASTFFDRNETSDLLMASSTSGDTSGSGETGTVTSSSVSSFTFSKNMQFQSVSHTNLAGGSCPELESDADGIIWAHNSGGDLEQYDAAKRKFVERSTAFDSWDLAAFDVAPDGAIWASTSNPHTGLYRAYKGNTKEYTISGATYYDDVSVAPDGTVYVAVSVSGPRYLYYKSPNSGTFKKFSTYNNVREVSVGVGGDVWIVDADIKARRWNGSSFVKPENVTFAANDISVSKLDGTVYAKENGTSSLYKWNSMNKSFDKINNLTVVTITVDGEGRPWICNDTTPVIKRARD